MAHKIMILVLIVLAIALSEPAIAAALPPELRHFLELEHGPLAYAMVIDATIVGTAAVTGKKG
jgi:hypothetical protein